ncbi:MAG: aldo/keto reductase [Spirochaetaceae bacterium]|nr:aldo/keto reductase [Spirochaetaceae bacterium]
MSGNKLSVLGFGCMRFPRAADETERLVIDAIEAGINYFDTAYIYPGSEETLGGILAKHKARDRVFIATKLPLVLCRGPADFDKFFRRELERLQTEYVDYYLMHMLTDLARWNELCRWGIREWIAEKKKAGKIRQAGFSFHGSQGEFLAILDAYDWDFCQIQYNYSDENYQAGVTGLKAAAKKGIPVIVMEPLLGGKLVTGLPAEGSALFTAASPSPEAPRSPAAWAFRWLWNQDEVTVVLSGMSAQSQLRENLRTAGENAPLTAAELAVYRAVRAVFGKSYRVHCTGCNYCMPCPRHVNIPGCFAAYNASFSIGFVEGMKQYVTGTAATSANSSRATHCTACGACETHCPQHLPIRRHLKEVRGRMEPFWFGALMGMVRLVMR